MTLMQIKLFVGLRYNSERTIPASLIKIPFDGKEYIGFYLENPKPTLIELRHATRHLLDLLQKEWQEVSCDALSPVVFPELFCG